MKNTTTEISVKEVTDVLSNLSVGLEKRGFSTISVYMSQQKKNVEGQLLIVDSLPNVKESVVNNSTKKVEDKTKMNRTVTVADMYLQKLILQLNPFLFSLQ